MTEDIVVTVTTFLFSNVAKEFRRSLKSDLCIEDVIRLCSEEFNISAHSFPFFGLRVEFTNGVQHWLVPNRTLDSEKDAITSGKLFFRFRFKPARSLSRTGLNHRNSRGKHFGFRALLQQSLVMKDDLWLILLGQCEKDLEKETLQLLGNKQEARGDLWALMLLGRSEATLRKINWRSCELKVALPSSLIKHKRFMQDVKGCICDATQKFGDKVLHDVWITFLEEYVYENNDRFIDKYDATYECRGSKDVTGLVFMDTQECSCFPTVKFSASNFAQDICSLKDIDSYSINGNSLKLLLRRQGQVCSFIFKSLQGVLSFASELDAQFRTSIDWYANLCSDKPRLVFSPRADMLKRNIVLPPAGLSNNLPGIKMSDDIPSSILSLRPFVLQQSSQKVGSLKVTFAKHVMERAELNWQLRLVNSEARWTMQDFSGADDFYELTNLHQQEFDSLESACRALLDELKNRDVEISNNPNDNDVINARLAHIGCSPRIHFVDPELVEEVKLEGNFQGLPVLATSSSNRHHGVIKLLIIADGNYSRIRFSAWNGMQYLLREYSGQRNHLLSRFWQSAELSTFWSHYGLAPVLAFSPASDFYLMEFASNGPLDVYLSQNGGCNSAVYLTHLLLAMKTLTEALAYLSDRDFVHGDVRLANVILLSHTVEPPVTFTVKLIPPELSATRSNEDTLPSNCVVFAPPNGSGRNDVYSLGVSMIQLLRLGQVPSENDVETIKQNEPKLVHFLEDFPHSAGEYSSSVARLLSLIKSCLLFCDKAAAPFLSNCAKEIVDILAVVRNLPQVTLNAASASSGPKLVRFFHIPYWEIFPSEEFLNENNDLDRTDVARRFSSLSHGHFGEVLLGIWRPSPRPDGATPPPITVALKRLLHDRPDDSQMTLDRLTQEFNIWSILRHVNIVRVHGLTWLNERPCIVMEYIKDGLTLEKYSRGKSRDLAFFKEMTSLLLQVTSGMRELSERSSPIVHCDLAARNVLISSEIGSNGLPILVAKIADFGLACIVDPQSIYHHLPSSQQMPTAWCAPEVLDAYRATPQSDVYSFGVLSWEVLCQKNPKEAICQKKGKDQKNSKQTRPKAEFIFSADIPRKLAETLAKCLKPVPEERPTFMMLETFLRGILEHNEF